LGEKKRNKKHEKAVDGTKKRKIYNTKIETQKKGWK
jgi:hypothetical protein